MPLTIIELVLQIVLEAIKGQPPDVKAELWKMYVADITAWREFWSKVFPRET